MRHPFDRRWRRLTALVVVLLATAGGVAYATIPGSGNTYTACMLKNVGTVRLIDPTLPSSNLLSHCTAFETQISWNQQGQKGDPGAPGVPGKNGADGANGVSPTVAQLSSGDSHCPAGGAAITDAAGTTAYVCSGANGQDGKDGQPFAGSFTSPNGLFSLTVADSGIALKGPDATIALPQAPLLGVRITSTGEVLLHANDLNTEATHDEAIFVAHDLAQTIDHDATIHIGHDRTETVDNNQTLTIHGDRTETVDGNQGITIHGNRSETVGTNESIMIGGSRTESVGGSDGVNVGGSRSENVGGADNVQAGVVLNLRGSLVRINDGGTNCQLVARVGDLVSPSGGVIVTGSATVCVGP
jgi:Gp5 C-terminal repeat (3 copies)